MPRKSPYVIVLSSAEREQLQRLASSYTSPYCDVMRAKMILLAAEGLGNDDIDGQRRAFEQLAGLGDATLHEPVAEGLPRLRPQVPGEAAPRHSRRLSGQVERPMPPRFRSNPR